MDNFEQLLKNHIVDPIKHKFSVVETNINHLNNNIASLNEKKVKQANFIDNLSKKIAEFESHIHNLKNELIIEKNNNKKLLDAISKLNWE